MEHIGLSADAASAYIDDYNVMLDQVSASAATRLLTNVTASADANGDIEFNNDIIGNMHDYAY